MFDNVLVFFRLRTLYTFNCEKVVGNPEKPSKFFKKAVDFPQALVQDISTMNDESRLKTYQITFWINTFEDGNNVQSDSDALIKKWLNDFIQSQAQQDQSLSESKSNFTSIFSGGVDNVEMIRSINADQLKKVVDFRVG